MKPMNAWIKVHNETGMGVNILAFNVETAEKWKTHSDVISGMYSVCRVTIIPFRESPLSRVRKFLDWWNGNA